MCGGPIKSIGNILGDVVKPIISAVDKVVDVVPDKKSSPAPQPAARAAASATEEKMDSKASLLTNSNPILGGGDRGGSGTMLTGYGVDPTKTFIGKDKSLG